MPTVVDDDVDKFMESRRTQVAASAPSALPHAKPGPYATKLSPSEEQKFQGWVKQNKVPSETPRGNDDPGYKANDNFYDMRGYWKAMASGDKNAQTDINPDDHLPHYPDTYKTPYHKSFSNESMYATPDAPHWEGSKLVPTQTDSASDDVDAFMASRSEAKAPAVPRTPPPSYVPPGTGATGIGAAPLTIGQRIKRVIGAGAPEGSVVANATGQTGTRGTPQLIAPEAAMTETEQEKHPIVAGAAEFAGGMTSPDNLMLLGLTAGAGQLAGPGAQVARRLLSAGFRIPMLISAAQQTPAISDAFRRNDYPTALRLLTKAGLTAGLAGLGGKDMLEEAQAAPATGFTKVADSAKLAARAGSEKVKAPKQPEGHIGPKMEPLAPESPATLQAQTDALAKGTNKTVYFPKGTESVPPPPENAKVTIVPGDQPGAGTWYHAEDVKPLTILKAVENGTFGELLGNHQSKADAISGAAPAAVVARDGSGTEVKASLVDSAKPEIVAAQAATLQRQFPKAEISVEPAEKVVGERLGEKPKATEKAPAVTASPETPQAEKRSASSIGTPPTGTPERRLAPGPPPEQNRLLTEYRRRLATATTTHEQETLKAQIADIQGTEGALRIGGGGEQMARDISAAREKSSGQPISKEAALANQAKRKTGVPRSAPVSKVYTPASKLHPEVRAEAEHEIRAASELASSFERPGRYFAGIGQTEEGIPQRSQSSAKGIHAGGVWYGVSSSKHIVADQFPWIGDIKHGAGKLAELAAKGKGAEYERLISTVAEHIQREKESAAPVIAEFAPKLKELSTQIDGHDPELSETLAQLANGDGRGFKNLRQYIEGKIADAEPARDFYRLIDAAANEARQASLAEPAERSSEPGAEESSQPAKSTVKEPAANPELLKAETVNPKSTEKQNVLPGLESAVEEQKAGAERVRGEKLSEEVKRPLGNIDQAAGEMERKSPLFRGTEASPQRELPQIKTGDSISVASGSLKGKTVEVTKVGDTGVYVRASEDGPIKFVKNGDFSVADLASGKTLFANPVGVALKEGSKILSRAWDKNVARPLIDKVLRIGDKYLKAREADPAVAEGLHLLDNAPQYLRAKADQEIKNVVGGLSRAQEKLFVLMADADSRANLEKNHPAEFKQAQNDSAVQDALRKYRPLEQELTAAREKMGGATLEQDYLRRVYEKYVAGVGKSDAKGGQSEIPPAPFDRVIRPQKLNNKSREATAEYHYQQGLHEFGPAFATKYVATHLKALRDEVAQEFLSKATTVLNGAAEPHSIEYDGKTYFRPDVAKDMREGGEKNVQEYNRYDPTQGERFPVPVDGKFLGPRDLVQELMDYGRKEKSEPGSFRRFLQEQILGFGFGVPHIFNIMRRVTQNTAGSATNPVAWARAMKVAFSKELRDRGIEGLNDPTFDMLAKHGGISTGEAANLKRYLGGNWNPANWLRGIAQIGHKFLFEPGSFGGFGGFDQRARLYVADLMRSQNPKLSDTEISRSVNDALGEYSRANWTDRQKLLGRFMMFPGWDFSSMRWILQHPIRTTLPPAILTLLANRALHMAGKNRGEDQDDIGSIHYGDRAFSTGLLRESMARNLFRPALNYAQAKVRGESDARALDEASRGVTQGIGGLLNTVRPDLSGFVALAVNRENLSSSKEIVSKQDYNTPGKILPSRALEKQAAFAVRRAFPAIERMMDSNQDVDLRSFAGGNLGFPNYKDDAEKHLIRNLAESERVAQSISKLVKTNPERARQMMKDPDNAAYALFKNDLMSLSKSLHEIDQKKEAIDSSKLPDAQKKQRLQQLDQVRGNVLSHADGLDRLLFSKRMSRRAAAVATSGAPYRAPLSQ